MKITYNEFRRQLLGTRTVDAQLWASLNMEAALWEMFAFDDHGAIYVGHECRKEVNYEGQ